MGVVGAAAMMAILASCYAPSLRDCVVSCAAPADCAAGQTCTAAGFCAAPSTSCGATGGVIDAPAARDGGVEDAASGHDASHDATIDAFASDTLHVAINGPGKVIVDGVGTCASGPPSNGACTYAVPAGAQLTAHAIATDEDHMFDKWTDAFCMGQGATCTFSAIPITTIQAHFK